MFFRSSHLTIVAPALAFAWLLVFGCSSSVDRDGERSLPPGFKLTSVDPYPADRGLARLHYPVSNEARLDLFQDEIRDLGGGYVGVGTDQNFCLIALARSRYAWLMDFDPVVVNINKIHLYFIEISNDYDTYRARWHQANRLEAFQLIEKRFGARDDYRDFVYALNVVFPYSGSRVWNRLEQLEYMSHTFGLDSFASNSDHYDYVRELARAGRIQAVPGDLRGYVTLREAGEAARRLGVPIRIFYPSNAEDYWRFYGPGFRDSVASLPADEKSVVIRTTWRAARFGGLGVPAGEVYSSAPFHYNIQPLQNLQEWMQYPGTVTLMSMLRFAEPRGPGFSYMSLSPGNSFAFGYR